MSIPRLDAQSRQSGSNVSPVDAVESSAGVTFSSDEVTILAVEHLQQCHTETLTTEGKQELREQFNQGSSIEVLVANYMQKKASKEIRGTGNEPGMQARIDEAKLP